MATQGLLSITGQVREATNVSSRHLFIYSFHECLRNTRYCVLCSEAFGRQKPHPCSCDVCKSVGRAHPRWSYGRRVPRFCENSKKGTFHPMWGPGMLPGGGYVEAQCYRRSASLGGGWEEQPPTGPAAEGSMVHPGNRTQLATVLVGRDGAGFAGGHQLIMCFCALPRTLDLILKAMGVPWCMAGGRFA